MPYYIAAYDINTKRGPKALNLFRQYLTWVQNSVFEGELTRAQFEELQSRTKRLIRYGEDTVVFYELRDERYAERRVIGYDRVERGRFL